MLLHYYYFKHETFYLAIMKQISINFFLENLVSNLSQYSVSALKLKLSSETCAINDNKMKF